MHEAGDDQVRGHRRRRLTGGAGRDGAHRLGPTSLHGHDVAEGAGDRADRPRARRPGRPHLLAPAAEGGAGDRVLVLAAGGVTRPVVDRQRSRQGVRGHQAERAHEEADEPEVKGLGLGQGDLVGDVGDGDATEDPGGEGPDARGEAGHDGGGVGGARHDRRGGAERRPCRREADDHHRRRHHGEQRDHRASTSRAHSAPIAARIDTAAARRAGRSEAARVRATATRPTTHTEATGSANVTSPRVAQRPHHCGADQRPHAQPHHHPEEADEHGLPTSWRHGSRIGPSRAPGAGPAPGSARGSSATACWRSRGRRSGPTGRAGRRSRSRTRRSDG